MDRAIAKGRVGPLRRTGASFGLRQKHYQGCVTKVRSKNEIEKVTQRGEIRLEICVDRSNLMPDWWELRKRYCWWKLAQQVKNDRDKLDVETQAALYWAEEALERELRKAYG